MSLFHPTAELLDVDRGLRRYREPEGCAVARPWRGWRHLGALLMGLIITTLAVVGLINRAATSSYADHIVPWWAMAGMGIALLYYAGTAFNWTVVRIRSDGVQVHSGPLPLPGRGERIYPRLRSVDVRHDRVVTPRGGVGEIYLVEGRTTADRHIVLDLMRSKDQADAMARLIRRCL